MRTLVLLALAACVAFTSAIPVENSAEDPDSSKYLKDQVRTKRGWGYEPVYTHTAFVPSPEIHTTVLGPSKTIITAAHPPVQTTSYVTVPHTRVYSYAPATHSESIVWQSGPDHSYVVHQRHSPKTYYYYTPTTTTHLLNHGPVIAW